MMSQIRIGAVGLLLLLSTLHAQSVQLARGAPIERQIKAGETHEYHVTLRTGEFVRGTVDQRGIAIQVRGFFPDGTKIRSFNGPSTGPRRFRFVAEAPGTYRLELKPIDSTGAGSYRIQIDEIQAMADRLKIAPEEKYRSPRIERLGQQVQAGNGAALSAFWRQVAAEGAPLAETIAGDDEYLLVTFLWRATLDNLIVAGKIPPVVVALIDNINDTTRNRELPCNPEFAAFLHQELMPWLRGNYRVTENPREIVVGGVSHGGLAAVCVAMRHPDTFGNVLAQSGSLWWSPGQTPTEIALRTGDRENWVARQFIDRPKLPVRFFLEAGLFEADVYGSGGQILEANRHLRDVLRAKGYEVHYQEFVGGHDWLNWRGSLADGLIALLGSGHSASIGVQE